jgi:hypothetical protein
MLDEASYQSADSNEKFYGKYQGTVHDNDDPDHLGRLQAFVPSLLGQVPTGWAKPCVPYGGPTSGFFSVPPKGAGVWIEFEEGCISLPIWTGCYWGAAELPMKPPGPPGEPSPPTMRIWRTDTGLTVVMDEKAKTITLTDGATRNSVEVNAQSGSVTVTGEARVVSRAPRVLHGSASAPHPGVLGDELMKYLAELVLKFNAHMHPGETVAAIIPVTPALPQPIMPAPTPSLLSKIVALD